MQQIISKKNALTTSVDKRSVLTGQVTSESKIAKLSDSEVGPILSYGGVNAAKELLGFRADNKSLKQAAYNEISRFGYLSMKSIKYYDKMSSKATLNTVDVWFLGAGLKTNLVTDNNELINPDTEININPDETKDKKHFIDKK